MSNLFCKELDSNVFQLYRPYGLLQLSNSADIVGKHPEIIHKEMGLAVLRYKFICNDAVMICNEAIVC